MCSQENSQSTYSRFNDMLDWHFNINSAQIDCDLNDSEQRVLWFADVASAVVKLVPEFAQVANVRVSTDSQGDNAFARRLITADGLQQLDHFLRKTQDTSDVNFLLELLCAQPMSDGSIEEFSIHGRCMIIIDNNYSKHNLDYLAEAPASIRLSLGTDIYSPFTFAPKHDNRVLAAINGPRLSSFLHRLQDSLPLILSGIESQGYEKLDLIDQYGFKMPADPAAFEKLLQSG